MHLFHPPIHLPVGLRTCRARENLINVDFGIARVHLMYVTGSTNLTEKRQRFAAGDPLESEWESAVLLRPMPRGGACARVPPVG